MTKTIAIIAWGAMADVLYATPIVRKIRQMHPDASLTWLVRDKFADVIRDNSDINKVEEFHLAEGYDNRQDAEYEMDKWILEYANDKKRFDKVYDLQYWPRYNNFYENPTEDFISLRARNVGIDPTTITDRQIALEPSDDHERAARSFMLENNLDPLGDTDTYPVFITVNHISYAASPVWSLENYQSLVDSLAKKGIKAIFTGAPNEPIPDRVIDARGMPYMEWASLIEMSNLWLGLDSGAVALACSSDVPIIKLHSPDFPLNKTGIKAMGLRSDDRVLELCPAPNVDTMTDHIERLILR